ncbi:regulatory protein, luxR family [Dyadobacter koreensis]|uniref:Regulatory protein, luxR family n=1 Tax=Dyadobacter koreensis TaxID=408657 RepID=A0A1H6VU44_9BACT|nr:helix-turn-helix transcriptional regulator [Dyadobacter koreensis]SEJ03535.1 regulatory protein, luxR family [Dyadobacter koreensis]
MKKEKNSWISYIGGLSQISKNYELSELENVIQILSPDPFSRSLLYHGVPVIYLMDYSTGRYVTMSKSSQITIGSKADYFIDGGINYTLEIYHKEDMRMFNERIFPDRLNFLEKVPFDQHPDYLFSYNYRLKRSNGGYVNLLQRNCIIKSDEKGKLILSLGMIVNIDHYKNENPVIHTIEKISKVGVQQSCELINKKLYYLHEEDQLFSNREKEVLLWMVEGLSSKQIADKMYLSEHTVINHRRNMMDKTGISNATALVGYALRMKII